MDTLATPLTTMALPACAYGTHEKPKRVSRLEKRVKKLKKELAVHTPKMDPECSKSQQTKRTAQAPQPPPSKR